VNRLAGALPDELDRRRSRTDLVERLFRERPLDWISFGELANVGGACAWRTRVADARRRFRSRGEGSIEWNGNCLASAYRYVPFTRLARDASTAVEQPDLF
jgi:hypothetical protein